MSKIGGMFFDELTEAEEIEFEFDKFMEPILKEEKEKAKTKAKKGELSENRKMDRYLDRSSNKIKFSGRK